MIKTHQANFSNHFDITAWQFLPDKPVPVWVTKSFHMLGNPKVREGISVQGKIIKLRHTEWAIYIEGEGLLVLTDEQFKSNFNPL